MPTAALPSPDRAGDPARLLPAALLWDMDGTLVDSEPYWIAEEFALVESFGGQWSLDLAHQLVGQSLTYSAGFIMEHSPVRMDPVDLINRLQDGVIRRFKQQVPWRPGAYDAVAQAQRLGIPQALVTASWSAFADEAAALLPEGALQAVISGDRVSKGKPDPEPYLAGAAALGVAPGDCMAFEDSPSGIASASAAGTNVVVIPFLVEVVTPAGGQRIDTLEGVDLAALWQRFTSGADGS